METLVMVIMLLIAVAFVIKLTYHGPIGLAVTCAVGALFVFMTWEYAALQSKTQIADWLADTGLMLDTSVVLTIDVAVQMVMCVLMAKKVSGNLMSRRDKALLELTLWFPGILIFPVIFAMLVKMMFSFTGRDFSLIGWFCGAVVVVGLPLAVYCMKWLLRDDDDRLELMFLVNGLIAVLGIIATVNGRTAATGTNEVDLTALGGICAILALGTVCGLVIDRIGTNRQIKRIIK